MNQLKQISQINDITFVHASGFIGGAKSFESTLRMALISLKTSWLKIIKLLLSLKWNWILANKNKLQPYRVNQVKYFIREE